MAVPNRGVSARAGGLLGERPPIVRPRSGNGSLWAVAGCLAVGALVVVGIVVLVGLYQIGSKSGPSGARTASRPTSSCSPVPASTMESITSGLEAYGPTRLGP